MASDHESNCGCAFGKCFDHGLVPYADAGGEELGREGFGFLTRRP
jgi:hypothetical protein